MKKKTTDGKLSIKKVNEAIKIRKTLVSEIETGLPLVRSLLKRTKQEIRQLERVKKSV